MFAAATPAARGPAGAGSQLPQESARRGLDPILRSQLLRSRSRHGAAAGSSGEDPSCPGGAIARADALLNLSGASWSLVRKSRLRMAYIGAESPSDWLLHEHPQRHALRPDTGSGRRALPRHGVVPELSFMVAPPRRSRRRRPSVRSNSSARSSGSTRDGDHHLYLHAAAAGLSAEERSRARRRPAAPGSQWRPDPLSDDAGGMDGKAMGRLCLSCGRSLADRSRAAAHPELHHRPRLPIPDRAGCAQSGLDQDDLEALASWRYRFRRYDRPWELALSKRLVRLATPQVTSL